jgi:hypothetical protein
MFLGRNLHGRFYTPHPAVLGQYSDYSTSFRLCQAFFYAAKKLLFWGGLSSSISLKSKSDFCDNSQKLKKHKINIDKLHEV